MLFAQSPKYYTLVHHKQNPLIVYVRWDAQEFLKNHAPKDSILVEAFLENGYTIMKKCSIMDGELEYHLPNRERQINVYYVYDRRKRQELMQMNIQPILPPAVSNAPPTSVTWKIATTWNQDNVVILEELTQLINDLNKELKGEIIFEWVNQTKPKSEDWLHAVKSNEIQLLHASSSYWKEVLPCTIFLSHHPFGMTQGQMEIWLKAEGLNLLQEQFAKKGLAMSICGHSGESMGGWFNREIHTIEDFKDMWIRMQGLTSDVLERCGARQKKCMPNEVYSFLQDDKTRERGAIFMGAYEDSNLGLQHVGEYYYETWCNYNSAFLLLFNLDAIQSVDPRHRDIIQWKVDKYNERIYRRYLVENEKALDALRKKNVKIRKLPLNVISVLREKTQEALKKNIEADTSGDMQIIYDSYKKYLKK
jgi:TRAP-type mannitol/chloroaromatic compound transport system substrate-binding protein